jgi:glyoxylase-like metal-dependent hydrolase (beta-lactamase superfamily II)
MKNSTSTSLSIIRKLNRPAITCAVLLCASVLTPATPVFAGSQIVPGAPGEPYQDMPAIASLGVRIGQHLDIPESSKGPAIDPAKGYRIQDLGQGLYMVTDNGYQSMFMVYDQGVVVVDTPPSYAQLIPKAIAEVTDKPVTHVVYSHSHADHIGGTKGLGGHPIIIAQEETKRLLVRANDPNRPIPTVTFKDQYTLKVGGKVLELSYHGVAHEPGNIFIYAPAQRTLMVVDVVFPGWMPWRRFALAQDIPGYFAQVQEIYNLDWDTLVSGHVERAGTHADVALQLEFMNDLRNATRQALKSTKLGEELAPADRGNSWAFYGNYIDRVVIQSMNQLTSKWSTKLGGYDVYIWDQCYAMENSLRIDEQ